MSTLTTLIDRITADIEANSALPAHHQWLYAQPLAVPPDYTPCLTVYVWDQTFEPHTTDTLETFDDVRVGWVVDAAAQAETLGIAQQTLTLQQFAVTQRITDRLAGYKTGIPGLTPLREATLTRTTYRSLSEGLLWRFEAHLAVHRW